MISKTIYLKKQSSLFLSILSGLLLICSWPDFLFAPIIFFAWVPLFFIAQQEKNKIRFFLHALLSMFIWNVGTTWWIWNSTAAGAIGAIVANSLLMCIPLIGYYTMNKKYGKTIGCLSMIGFWLTFEYIHLNWQLSWPWLTLGNVFSSSSNWVQWYEYTGVSGGSLWVLAANLAIFYFLENVNKKPVKKALLLPIGMIAFPILISYLLLNNYTNRKYEPQKENVIIVQPNINPYTEKFAEGTAQEQIHKLVSLSEQQTDENTRLIIWPETALPVGVWQDQLANTPLYQPVFDFVKLHPQITLQTGIETYKNYGLEKATNTAKKIEGTTTYYDAFNAAISLKANEPIQFYNKSKLVPGVETLPDFLLWLSAIFEKFGGTAGGYGHDKESKAFAVKGNPYVTAPIICYESIYGEYLTTYVNKGANLLTIMTNDGWWGNTAGHRQHLLYAKLRAIENRKWVVRSANTGISAVIDNTGKIVETKGWDEEGVIKYNVPTCSATTFYTKYGDLLFNLATFLTGALITFHLVALFKKKRAQ